MSSDPEPGHGIAFKDADSPIAARYSDGPNVLIAIDALEMK